MDLSLIMSIVALLVSVVVLVLNFLKPFELLVRVSNSMVSANKDKNMGIDLVITFINLGKRAGLIENLGLEFEQENKNNTLVPEIFYKLSEEKKLTPQEHWHPFVLQGNSEISKIVGFKSNISINSLREGEREAILKIYFKKNPRTWVLKSIMEKISFNLNIREAIQRGKPESKKPAAIFPFDFKILESFFSGQKKS